MEAKHTNNWTENADEISRLREINAELLKALVRCQMEMDYAGWGTKAAISARSTCYHQARAALAKVGQLCNQHEIADTFGCALAMRVLQSDLYKQLDDTELGECDELIRRWNAAMRTA